MLTEEEQRELNDLVRHMEGRAGEHFMPKESSEDELAAFRKHQHKLMDMAERLRSFTGGYWFSIYMDMKLERNIMLNGEMNRFIWGTHVAENGEPEALFKAVVEASEVPVRNDALAQLIRKQNRENPSG